MTCQRCGNYILELLCTHCGYEQKERVEIKTDSFKERLKNAKIIVIGASYIERDMKRWEQIDTNYIGIGRSYEDEKFTDNPFKDLNWNEDEHYWFTVFKKIKDTIDHTKKFKVFIDRGTVRHIKLKSWTELIEILYEYRRITDSLCIPNDSFELSKDEIPRMYMKREYAHIKEQLEKEKNINNETKLKRKDILSEYFMFEKTEKTEKYLIFECYIPRESPSTFK